MATEERRSWRGPRGTRGEEKPHPGRLWWRPNHAQVPGMLCGVSLTPAPPPRQRWGPAGPGTLSQGLPGTLATVRGGAPWPTSRGRKGGQNVATASGFRRLQGRINYSV